MVTNLDFRFPECFNHEPIILRQEEDTAALPWRRKFPQCIISANGHHIISCIDLEHLPQVPTRFRIDVNTKDTSIIVNILLRKKMYAVKMINSINTNLNTIGQ